MEREGTGDERGLLKSLEVTLRSYEKIAKESIPSQWIPAHFAILGQPFSEEDGLVNSTMKLVRYKVIEAYRGRIDQMYESDQINERKNLEVLKELFFA